MNDWKEIEAEVDGTPLETAEVAETEETVEQAPTEEATEGEQPEGETKVEAKAEDKPEDKAEAKTEDKTETKAEPLRDEKGRFIPLDRHEEVLRNQRLRNEALERELAELKERTSKIPAEPDESDKAFEERISNFPDEVQAVLREQREEVKSLRREREEEKQAREREETAKKEATEHDSALAATETLTEVWKDKGLRTLLTTISSELIDNPEYKAADRAAHYKDVEKEFYQRYPQLRTASQPKQTTEPKLPETKAKPIAPSSMSSIRGAVAEPKSQTESFDAANPLALVARTNGMSNEELDRYFASI